MKNIILNLYKNNTLIYFGVLIMVISLFLKNILNIEVDNLILTIVYYSQVLTISLYVLLFIFNYFSKYLEKEDQKIINQQKQNLYKYFLISSFIMLILTLDMIISTAFIQPNISQLQVTRTTCTKTSSTKIKTTTQLEEVNDKKCFIGNGPDIFMVNSSKVEPTMLLHNKGLLTRLHYSSLLFGQNTYQKNQKVSSI